MTRRLALTLLALLVAALAATWFLMNFERVEESVYAGYRGEARYNSLLAATRLLEKLGLQAESQAGLWPQKWLPALDDTLVLPIDRRPHDADDSRLLFEWIEEGGHLIVAPTPGWAQQGDELLDGFGVEIAAEACGEIPAAGTVDLEHPAENRQLEVSVLQNHRLADTEQWAGFVVSDDCGPVLLQYQYGSGLLSVLASPAVMFNTLIGEHDNARFFVDLITGVGAPGKVWLIYGMDYPPLPQLLFEKAWPAMVALMILLAAYLWRVVPRFGPVIPARPPVRRSLLEHVRASGRLLWKRQTGAVLLNTSRAAVLEEITRRHPGFRHWDAREQIERVAEHTGLPASEIRLALRGASQSAPGRFAQQLRILQRMRNQL